MRVRLIIESDVVCPAGKSKKDARKEFDEAILGNLAGSLRQNIPGEIVYVAVEVLDSGLTQLNNRKHP